MKKHEQKIQKKKQWEIIKKWKQIACCTLLLGIMLLIQKENP